MSCPFLDRPFRECLPTLSFANLEKATRLCGNDFCECPIFARKFQRIRAKSRFFAFAWRR